jgi:hypothetical protein
MPGSSSVLRVLRFVVGRPRGRDSGCMTVAAAAVAELLLLLLLLVVLLLPLLCLPLLLWLLPLSPLLLPGWWRGRGGGFAAAARPRPGAHCAARYRRRSAVCHTRVGPGATRLRSNNSPQ